MENKIANYSCNKLEENFKKEQIATANIAYAGA